MLDKIIHTNEDMGDECDIHACNSSEIAIFTRPAPFKASPNEDSTASFCIDDTSAVLAIADGLGGPPQGADASALAITTIASELDNSESTDTPLREMILNAIEQANNDIMALGVGAGTTFACIEINNDIVRTYHAGDSVILIVGQRGKIKLQTMPHSPVGYAVEAGLLNEKEAMEHQERHIISNMLGNVDMRIDIGPAVKLSRYDTVLLASDGLFDNLHIDEIVETIRKGPLPRIASKLIVECNNRMQNRDSNKPSKPDDLSFILYRRKK